MHYTRIIECTRIIHALHRNGEVQQATIQLETPAVGMVRLGKNILVACMNDVVHSYQVRDSCSGWPKANAPSPCTQMLYLFCAFWQLAQ